MAASKEDIGRWFDNGVAKGATHLIVVCDTFDHDDYPTYVMPGEDARHKHTELHGSNMRKVMEVYALHLDKDSQMAEHRSFHYELPDPATLLADHLVTCAEVDAVIVEHKGSADDLVARLLADGWKMSDKPTEQLLGKRIRYMIPPNEDECCARRLAPGETCDACGKRREEV